MSVALRPLNVKILLIAAGVLLGLLAIALMVLLPGAHAAHAEVVNGVNSQFHPADGTQILAGVLWH